jgi:homoserine acetyltransferase
MSTFPSTAQQLSSNDLYPVRDDVVLINGPLRLMCGRMLDKVRVACRLAGEPGLCVLLVPGGTGCLTLPDLFTATTHSSGKSATSSGNTRRVNNE